MANSYVDSPYQPANGVWLKPIPQHFSDETLHILQKLDLVKTNSHDFDVAIGPALKCSKYSYAAETGKHMMPNSPSLFALTQSSGNVLLITENFSSKYLKYAAGKEEHPEVLVKSGTSENTVRVEIGGIENRKISGASVQYEKEKNDRRPTAGISALHVAQTEFIWWALRLPCIISTFDFVHVPSVALEHRGACKNTQLKYYPMM